MPAPLPTISSIFGFVTRKAGTKNIPWTLGELERGMRVPVANRATFRDLVMDACSAGLLQGLGYQGQPLGRVRLPSSLPE